MLVEEAQNLIGRTGRIAVPPDTSGGGGIRIEWPPQDVRVVGYEVDPDSPGFAHVLLVDVVPNPRAVRDNREIPDGRVRPGWFRPNPKQPR